MLLMMITAMYFLNVFQDKQMEALVEKLCNRFSGVTGVCSLYLIFLSIRHLLSCTLLHQAFLEYDSFHRLRCQSLIH